MKVPSIQTARTTTNLMLVGDFTNLIHRFCIKSVKIKLDASRYSKTCCKLLKQPTSSLWIKRLGNQLESSLLTIVKPEQAMRSHLDIGLMTTSQWR